MFAGWLWSFHPRNIPPMQRANYARELLSWAFLPARGVRRTPE